MRLFFCVIKNSLLSLERRGVKKVALCLNISIKNKCFAIVKKGKIIKLSNCIVINQKKKNFKSLEIILSVFFLFEVFTKVKQSIIIESIIKSRLSPILVISEIIQVFKI